MYSILMSITGINSNKGEFEQVRKWGKFGEEQLKTCKQATYKVKSSYIWKVWWLRNNREWWQCRKHQREETSSRSPSMKWLNKTHNKTSIWHFSGSVHLWHTTRISHRPPSKLYTVPPYQFIQGYNIHYCLYINHSSCACQ